MKNVLRKAVDGFLYLVDSCYKFAQGSIVSIFVIVLILLLLTKLEQAFVMVIELNEDPTLSFAVANILIFALALSLSHYPIYTYYAGNVNGSRDHFIWKETRPKIFLRLVRVRYFVSKPVPPGKPNYESNVVANVLRYLLGFALFPVWFHIVWRSYAPNYMYQSGPSGEQPNWVYWLMMGLMLLAIVFYSIYRFKLKKYLAGKVEWKIERFFTIASTLFIVFLVLIVTLLISMSFSNNFSPSGLYMNMALILLMTCTYFLFRLLRNHFGNLSSNAITTLIRFFRIQHLQDSVNYLKLLTYFAIGAFAIIVYANIQVFWGMRMMNGIPIVLAYLYFYSFLILTIGKYFFIANIDLEQEGEDQPIKLRNTLRYYLRIAAIVVFIAIAVLPMFKSEQNTNLVCTVHRDKDDELTIAAFEKEVMKKDTVFFIASHGGGLMANTWTLKVLNHLQRETNGRLLENTIAVSGASGGSLGLSLYLAMYGQDGNDFKSIDAKIAKIVRDNYTSVDLTLLFGIDSYRSLWPLRGISGYTRTHYKMQRYQQHVNSNYSGNDTTAFRTYWKGIFNATSNKQRYAPSLIMNTAGMDGRRGILWSVQPEKGTFNHIFHYAVDLAEMNDSRTLSYFDATSLTNRFPVFSPSAKIKHYGHFIDAGAIDNSGLLGCLDVLKYLVYARDKEIMQDKYVVFVEISNSKSLYVKYLLKEYLKKHPETHLLGNEDENSSLSNNITAGTNLDKFPGYLEGFMGWMEKELTERIDYVSLPLPRKVSMADIESVLKGTLVDDPSVRNSLQQFLDAHNREVQRVTEGSVDFTENWRYYEPVLARHFSESVIRYNDSILNHQLLRERFKEIVGYTGR